MPRLVNKILIDEEEESGDAQKTASNWAAMKTQAQEIEANGHGGTPEALAFLTELEQICADKAKNDADHHAKQRDLTNRLRLFNDSKLAKP